MLVSVARGTSGHTLSRVARTDPTAAPVPAIYLKSAEILDLDRRWWQSTSLIGLNAGDSPSVSHELPRGFLFLFGWRWVSFRWPRAQFRAQFKNAPDAQSAERLRREPLPREQ